MNLSDIIKEVRKLADKYPDNKYWPDRNTISCYYNKGPNTHCQEQGCIFGIVLRRYFDLSNIGQSDISTVIRILHIPFSDNQIWWCSRVQQLQDEKYTWSDAVRIADKNLNEFGGLHDYKCN